MSSNSRKSAHIAGKLGSEKHHTLSIPALGAVDKHLNVERVSYHPVPSSYATIENAPVWRVLLKFGKRPRRVVVGLDICGDTVLGRGSGGSVSPDIDLTHLDALERGVSRIHALMRPTPNALYLIDLNSTNGTFINAIQLRRETPNQVRNRDEIAFAMLTCVVEIVLSPSHPIELPPPEASPVVVEEIPKFDKPKTGTETIFGVKVEFPPTDKDTN
jgi:pSer/pThr/pTyr-binding forkhead associated (FHA) protein